MTPADRTEYKQILNDRAADFVIDLASDFSTAEDCGYKLTDSYLGGVFLVLLRSHDGDLRRVAVAYNFNTGVLELPGLDDCATVGTWTLR